MHRAMPVAHGALCHSPACSLQSSGSAFDVQIVFSGVFLLTPGKEAYRLKAHEDEDELPILSSPRANSGPVSIQLV